MSFARAPCSEFPNDNPQLHFGARWGVEAPTAAPSATPPEEVPQADAPTMAAELVQAVEELVSEIGELGCSEPPPSSDAPAEDAKGDPFHRLARVLADVVTAAGGDGPILGELLGLRRLDAERIPASVADVLVAGGILERGARGMVRTQSFVDTALAWASVLRGENDDLSSCGALTLDQWCAELVARVLGAPGRAEPVRRELRRSGVAAFGLLDAA